MMENVALPPFRIAESNISYGLVEVALSKMDGRQRLVRLWTTGLGGGDVLESVDRAIGLLGTDRRRIGHTTLVVRRGG